MINRKQAGAPVCHTRATLRVEGAHTFGGRDGPLLDDLRDPRAAELATRRALHLHCGALLPELSLFPQTLVAGQTTGCHDPTGLGTLELVARVPLDRVHRPLLVRNLSPLLDDSARLEHPHAPVH